MVKTPHIIGNEGEAPFDPDPGIADRLRRIASDIDAGIYTNSARTEYSFDPTVLDGLSDTLTEIADEINEYEKRHGTAV